jgi:hypothetical protein
MTLKSGENSWLQREPVTLVISAKDNPPRANESGKTPGAADII